MRSVLSWITSKNKKTTNNLELDHLLEHLGYDFTQFTLTRFIEWIEKTEGLKIHVVPLLFPPTFYGALVKCPNHKRIYIFYDAGAQLLYQTHIILHELGHYLCGHKGLKFKNEALANPAVLVQYLQNNEPHVEQILYRNAYDNTQETEAELFATLVQKIALQHVAVENLFLSQNPFYEQYLRSIRAI